MNSRATCPSLGARPEPETEQQRYSAPGLPNLHYAELLLSGKPDNPADPALTLTGPGGALWQEQPFPLLNPDTHPPLRSGAVRARLTLEVFDPEDFAVPIHAGTASDGRIAGGTHGLCGGTPAVETSVVEVGQSLLTGATVY